MNEDFEPRVWVGCLGCYNGGNLVGEWFDADDAPTEMSALNDHLADTLDDANDYRRTHHFREAHEELWVFDHEGFDGLLSGECSPVEAVRLAELGQAIADDHYPIGAVVAWRDNGHDLIEWDGPTSDAFADSYNGEWASETEFAQDLAENLGAVKPDASWPNDCIDWEMATRELMMDYTSVGTPDHGVWIFRD